MDRSCTDFAEADGRDELMAFESLLAYSRFFGDTTASRREETQELRLSVTLDGSQGETYGEEAFRHFLALERLRAARSDRQFLLLLVNLRRCPERGVRFSSAVAANLLAGLELCVREVDFIGWYRHSRVVGAVLAQGLEAPASEAPNRVAERVAKVLRQRLPRNAADRLRVRVVRLGAPLQ